MTTTTVTPRIWIGCLAAYNAGKLHGEWVDAAVDEDEIWEAQKRVLRTSPEPGAEEHFIADHEGFAPYRVGEYDSLTTVARVARLIEEHGSAFAAWLSNDDSVLEGADDDDLTEAFRESFRGTWDSEEEFARERVADIGLPGVGFLYKQGSELRWQEQPSWSDTLDELDSYLDWDAIARAEMEGCWTADADEPGKIHVFESV